MIPRGMLALILLLAAAPIAAQMPGIPTPIVNSTPDTLDVFAVMPPGYGWIIAEALAPGDSVTAVVPAVAVAPDRHFYLGVRPVGTSAVHIAGRRVPGATIYVTKNRPKRKTGVVGT